MATRTASKVTIDDMLPLLRTIQVEINDRLEEIGKLEARQAAFEPTRHVHELELARIESELSAQRRELRQVSKELARLGVAFDPEHPHRIVMPSGTKESARLGETDFRSWMVDSTT
ncbi:MAG TPA: hypothetical protein VMT18_04585 [Planctomycetota bacterium]|nr:hypothetical protein [Planctomycetota bacterium]